ncbi:MAG: hypothetical protein ACR2N3_15700 [Pyrinomonadaceae bacterium]
MIEDEITFSDAIEKVMLHNSYFAPLSLIYKEFPKYRSFTGKTPLKTIQERVQRDMRFTRIGVGVYGLTKYLDKLQKTEIPKQPEKKVEYYHARIQGMLLEIGELENKLTYTNDKTKLFDGKQLGFIASLKNCPPFTYPEIVAQSARFFDVIWFNHRRFPVKVFEVENSTDFRGAFVKFTELQDFYTNFIVIAPKERQKKFKIEINKRAFEPIANRCKFTAYEDVETHYQSLLNFAKTRNLFD